MDTFSWRDELLVDTHARIMRNGYAMQYVSSGEWRYPPWTYTIGLVDHAHPELIVSGLDPPNAAGVLSTLADTVLAGARLDDPQTRLDVQGLPVTVIVVDPRQWTTDRFAVWVDYYGSIGRSIGRFPEPAALQVVGVQQGWPPAGRRFLLEWQRRQELLGVG